MEARAILRKFSTASRQSGVDIVAVPPPLMRAAGALTASEMRLSKTLTRQARVVHA
jgi:hypothetical protein